MTVDGSHAAGDLAYPLLAQLDRSGCGFCRLTADRDDRAVWVLLYEGRQEQEVRREVTAAGGFCAHHTDRLLRIALRDDLTASLAELFELVIAAVRVEPADRGGGRRRRRNPARPCPLCRQSDEGEQRMASFFADRLAASGDARDRYGQGDGFCAPHVRLVCAHAGEPEAAFLRADLDRRLVATAAGLREYRRKRDHTARDEPPGDERRAPARAAQLLARAVRAKIGVRRA